MLMCLDNNQTHRDIPIFAAGDLIDRKSNEAMVTCYLREAMNFCEELASQFVFIQGQHELQTYPKPTWIKAVSDWPTHLHDEEYRFEAGEMGGYDWMGGAHVEEQLECVAEETNILMMHQVVEEFLGGVTKTELSWEMIPPQVEMLIVGDFHQIHGRLDRQNSGGKPLVVLSPGSTAMQSISEPEHKKFFVLCDDRSTISIDIPSRGVLRPPVLHTEEDVDGFVEAVAVQVEKAMELSISQGIPNQLRNPLIHVKFDHDLKDVKERIARAISPIKGHYDQSYGMDYVFLKVLVPRDTASTFIPTTASEKGDVSHALLGLLDEVAPDDASYRHVFSRRLLENANTEEVLTKMRDDWFNCPFG